MIRGKRIFAVILAGWMAVRLAACSAASPYEAGKQAAETETNITEAQSREGRTPDSEEAEALQEQAREILNGESTEEPIAREYVLKGTAAVGGQGGIGGKGGPGEMKVREDCAYEMCLACAAPEAAYYPAYNTEEYSHTRENGFVSVKNEPLSTFSIDVDTASYANVRRYLNDGMRVPEDAVRTEELINYFRYDYKRPEDGKPFAVTTSYAACPWNEDTQLLGIGIAAEEIDMSERPASNLVFLLDVSGSMDTPESLPLVQKAFRMLAENLNKKDRISIVTYAGRESVVLEGEPGDHTGKIVNAINSLEAGGSTNGSAGIERAYEIAEKYYIDGGNNRVILATDGDLNVGVTSEGDLIRLIEKEREKNVHLSVLGVGTWNIKDNKMEALADHGDGNYSYLDSVFEAKKVLVDEMGATLITVAKDVKIQVEFNPAKVKGYRLIGYENRLLATEDFDDDTVDAGEIGAGHTVTALYEIVPAGSAMDIAETELKYQQAAGENETEEMTDELLTVSLRYKEPYGDKSRKISHPVTTDHFEKEAKGDLAWAAAVAEFGMLLSGSEYKGTSDFDSCAGLARSQDGFAEDDSRLEFLTLINRARDIYDGETDLAIRSYGAGGTGSTGGIGGNGSITPFG